MFLLETSRDLFPPNFKATKVRQCRPHSYYHIFYKINLNYSHENLNWFALVQFTDITNSKMQYPPGRNNSTSFCLKSLFVFENLLGRKPDS